MNVFFFNKFVSVVAIDIFFVCIYTFCFCKKIRNFRKTSISTSSKSFLFLKWSWTIFHKLLFLKFLLIQSCIFFSIKLLICFARCSIFLFDRNSSDNLILAFFVILYLYRMTQVGLQLKLICCRDWCDCFANLAIQKLDRAKNLTDIKRIIRLVPLAGLFCAVCQQI